MFPARSHRRRVARPPRMLRSAAILLFALAAAAQAPVPDHGRTRSVAVLVFEGVELLDFAGPVETLTVAGAFERPFRVFTVAPAAGPIRTHNQVRVVPDHAAADCPPFDILIVPGGETRCLGGDTPLARLIRDRGPAAEIVMSVCNGAFALADLGWLEGLEVTTHRSHLQWLREAVPSATVRNDRRYVDSGHIVTTAGVSAGIEGALHLVERLCGPEAARQAAPRMDYAWSESSQPVPAPKDAAERGRRAWFSGDWTEAAAAYAELYAQHADDRVVRLRLGTALLLRRRVDEALPHLEAAAQGAPDDLVA